jgi:carbamate kinase
MILTDVEKVAINYRTPSETYLDAITVKEAKKYMDEGQFGAGSMGPKVRAAIDFAYRRKTSIIASLTRSLDALEGKTGTRITL